jgi:hypothetical protein
MHAMLRSISLPLLLAAACQPAVSSTPPASPPASASSATDPALESEAPATAGEGEAEREGAVPKCGVGGTARENAASCEFLVDTSSGECCFSTKETACREAGCSVDDCSLQKSNPPQPICDGGAPPSGGAATCEAAGGECIPKAAAVPCKTVLSASCPGQQICCEM